MTYSLTNNRSKNDYMKTYNIIQLNDIVFEGHTSKKYRFGRFILNDFNDGIVSHVFDVYTPIIEMDSSFIKDYINNEKVMRKILLFSTSNARMLNSLNSVELNKQLILLPVITEQKMIGSLLKCIDSLIASNQLQQKRRFWGLKNVFLSYLYKTS